MRKHLISIVLLIFNYCSSTYAQDFTKVYAVYNFNTVAFDAVQMYDSSYYLCGYFDQAGCLIKTDSHGNIEMAKQYQSLTDVQFRSIIFTLDSCLVLSGSFSGKALLMKTTLSGDTIWTSGLDMGPGSTIYSVEQSTDSSFIVCGHTLDNSFSSSMFVARFSASGSLIWSELFSVSGGNMYGYSVRQCSDENFIIAAKDDGAALLISLNDQGDTLWTKRYSAVQTTFGTGDDVIQKDSCFYLASEVGGYHSVIKTDINGNIIWNRQYAQAPYGFFIDINSAPAKISETVDGQLLVMPANDMWSFGMAAVFDTSGNSNIGLSLFQVTTDISQQADGSYIACGYGPLQLVKGKDFPYDYHIAFYKDDSPQSGENCIYVSSGFSDSFPIYSAPAEFDVLNYGTYNSLHPVIDTIQYTEMSRCAGGVGQISELDEASFSVYPNPSNGAFSLQFDESLNNETCVIELYNMLGVCVYRVSEKIGNEIAVSVNVPQSGLYFVKVIGDDFNYSKAIEFVNE